MSSFQFPANPSDGDIVVRGNLQAFYNAATNTWRVSEVPTAPGIPGPPGPPGPIGPPGQGVAISGAVDTEANLPAPNSAQFEFWIVDDTNELYWSDGLTWTNFGGPIQGPQGIEGPAGADGTNGQNGRGWYDTSVDTSNDEYRVTFLSNDGLTFTTDNLKGPAGNDGADGNDGSDFNGTFPIATENSTGVVQIGDGIDIDTSGVISVNLEEAPLDTGTPVGGSDDSLAVSYAAQYLGVGAYTSDSWTGPRGNDNDYLFQDGSINVRMPGNANKALIWVFTTSTMGIAPDIQSDRTTLRAIRLYLGHELSLTNAVYTSGNTTAMSVANYHNLTVQANSETISARRSVVNTTKINRLEFEPGAEVTFDYKCWIRGSNNVSVQNTGRINFMILPYRDNNVTTVVAAPPGTYIQDGDDFFYMAGERDLLPDDEFTQTPEEIAKEIAETMRREIEAAEERINSELYYSPAGTALGDELIAYRDQLRAARNVSGTYEDVYNYLVPIIDNINSALDYQFPFE